mmetsp:Transcript_99133/g.171935  ORF Transcript_99133/g.171935 Transcript_99133/m.171935 type:complete len:219 (-) Transcript_99133:1964-2620(-)
MAKLGNALSTSAMPCMVSSAVAGTSYTFGSKSMFFCSAVSSKLFSKAVCSSSDMPSVFGTVISSFLSSSGSMTNIRTRIPRPCTEPTPMQEILLFTPLAFTAVLMDSARACDNFRLASLLSVGSPFVCPSHRRVKSGKAFSTLASELTVALAEVGISDLFGSNSMFLSRTRSSRESNTWLRSSVDFPVTSGISMSLSGSIANILTHMPSPCVLPKPWQ